MTVDPEVHVARLTSQLLTGPRATSAGQVVERLLAVQAQDGRAARLAVRSRSVGLARSDVDAALDARELVVSWLNRGTLHLVRSEDHAWLHALTAPTLRTTSARRLAQEGVSPEQAERGVRAVGDAVADGPRTRDELREVLRRADVPVAGQALVHVLLAATLRGLVVRGPVRGGEQAFVLAHDWLGAPPPVDRDAALRELALRYLAGHGPADDRELAVWSGLPLGDARRGLTQLGSAAVEARGLLDLADKPPPAALPGPQLLGGFEPVLLGWASREALVGEHRTLVTDNGIFRPFALVRGRAVATWGYARQRVSVTPLEPYDDDVRQALEREARDVERFLSH